MTVMIERVRGHRLLERAGQDGPWAVHLARSEATGAEVLVKTLACHRVDRRALKRIVRGFGFPEELAAHPGVLPVLEVGATGDGRPYLVTPLHDGLTLAERPGRSLPMPLDRALALVRAVADAVAATHVAGGVHGRVKPETVIVDDAGRAVLTGFAMSALMSIVELPDGTLPSVHAAPEELEGRPPVPASDVYALGSMLYELLAGRPAFPLDGPGSTARFALGVLTEDPPPLPLALPADVAKILSRALSKDPAARPGAGDFATALTSDATLGPTGDASRPRTARLPTGDTGAPLPAHPPAGDPLTARLPTGDPLTARLPAGDTGDPLTARLPFAARLPAPEGDADAGGRAERSAPRELVWTVDPDRSQVRPPAGPQPFAPPPPADATPPPGTSQAEPRRNSKIPLFVTSASALAVLVGVGSVALAMGGAPETSTAAQEQPVTATADAPATPAPDTPPQQKQQPDQQTPPPATSDPQDTRPPANQQTPPPLRRQTTDPTALATYRPKNLKVVADKGSTVTLSWKAVRKSGYPVVIQQAPGHRLVSAAIGSNTYTIGGLDPVTGYCFKVGTVVALGQPSSVAWSSAVCIRGATEADPGGGQDDEAQPPIVLPPATPPPTS